MELFKIEHVKMRKIIVPLKNPFQTKLQHVQEREAIIVELSTGDQTGLGECVAFTTPWYTEETIKMAWFVMKHYLIPELLKATFTHPDDLTNYFSHIKGNRMAKAAIEQALWDLYAKRQQRPLYEVLGGSRTAIDAGVVVTWQTVEELKQKVDRAVEDGYTRVKIKVSPQSDIEALTEVVQKYPDLLFFADANSTFTSCPPVILERFDTIGFRLFEQPFREDDWLDHQRLTEQFTTPIALDESIRSYADAKRLVRMHAADCIVLKPGRVGGTSRSANVIRFAKEHEVDVWLGGMIEFGISKAHNLALASLEGVTLPGDFSASNHFWEQDIIREPLTVAEGKMHIIEAPGIGVTLNEDVLRSYEYKRFES